MAIGRAREEIKQLVAQTKLKPHERCSLSLGNFDEHPTGFSIELGTDSLESVVTQIRIQESARGHKFVSFLTNNENKSVNVKIWQL